MGSRVPGARRYLRNSPFTSLQDRASVRTGLSAIGYLGLNYIMDGALAAIAFEGVEPSVETIKDGSYPLARELYMVTYGEPTEDAQAFLDFVTGDDGQAIAEELGFVSIL